MRILTPIAAGAIAVVQVAGPQAVPIAQAVFRAKSGKPLAQYPPGRLAYGDFLEADGSVLDDGLAWRSGAVGSPSVEFNLHGGVRIVQRLVRRLLDLGAELLTASDSDLAGPADHAFDWLCPLEQWMQQCLADAATPAAVGLLAPLGALWRQTVTAWTTHLQAGRLDTVLAEAQALLDQADVGNLWRGRTLAIIGLPNSGKSTLVNRLAGRNVSLVADRPGTTRDWVGEPVALAGWPVFLIDTAGIRVSDDPIEAEGVARALEQARAADLRLLVIDSSCPPSDSEYWLAAKVGLKSGDVVAYTKSDLPAGRRWEDGQTHIARIERAVRVSAVNGTGWSELERLLMEGFGFSALQESRPLVFCASLYVEVTRLASALRTRQADKAVAVLDGLLATH